MYILSNDVVLKNLFEKNFSIEEKTKTKEISKDEEKKFARFIQESNDTSKNSTTLNIDFFSKIPNCLKDYQFFHGCGKSPMDNVISLIAGICLFINSKIYLIISYI